MSAKAADVVASVVTLKPDCVIGLATGSTPVGMYQRLAELNKEGKIDFKDVKTYNLDEYYPIKPTDDQSYRYFMNKNLFYNINIDINNTHVLNGETADPEAECAAYDKAIEAAGGIDIQVLGIGNNGHIGFNEPDEELVAATHKTGLTANDVPKFAFTMGMAPIMKAKRIIILISGKGKRAVLREMLEGKLTTKNPATFLNLHSDVAVVCDEDDYNGGYFT